MCHYGQHIWILYTSGYAAVFDMESHKIIQNIELQELFNDPVTILVADHTAGLIAAAYTDGLVVYLWDGTIPNVSVAFFHSVSTITVTYKNCKLTTIESCTDVDGHCWLWCGYSNGVIQIVSPPDNASRDLQIHDYSTDLVPDAYITQLKFSGKKFSLMYALHDGGLMVSCWSANTNPKLCSIIETSTTTPGKMKTPDN